MLSKEIISRIRRIHITSKRIVNEVIAGQYLSAFKGKGIEFEEVREYSPGDDLRHIDWNVSARMGKPYIKLHREERELTVILCVDVSPSMNTGSGNFIKREIAAEVGAAIALCAVMNNDKVSLFLFSDKIELFIPPRKRQTHVWKIIKEILTSSPSGRGTNLARFLDEAVKYIKKKGGILFLISDFDELTEKNEENYQSIIRSLKVTSKKYDVIPIIIKDLFERELPRAGLLCVRDPERKEILWVDSSNIIFRKRYETIFDEHLKNLQRLFGSLNLDYTILWSGEDYIKPLIKLFRLRERKRWR